MASFIELTESQYSKKNLLNLEEITFVQVLEKKKSKTTFILRVLLIMQIVQLELSKTMTR